MKKYWAIFKVNWQQMLTYRANLVLWFITGALQTSVLLYLWIAIYDQGGKIGDYSFKELFTYYLLQIIIYQLATTFISWDIIQEIKDGFFSQYLLKPVSYIKWQFTSNMAFKASEIVFTFLGLVLLISIIHKHLILPSSYLNLFHTVFLIMLSAILSFLLEFIIGITAFWITNTYNFRFLIEILARFFSGSLIPLSLLPKSIFFIGQFLPFQFLTFVPIQVYLGKTSVFNAYLGIFFWIAFAAIFAHYFYKLSIKRYEAVGA